MNEAENYKIAPYELAVLLGVAFNADDIAKIKDWVKARDIRAWSTRNSALEEAANIAEGGRFLHDDSPESRFGKECAAAIRRAKIQEQK